MRIPLGLKRRLEEAQKQNRRKSLSAEIVARLAMSFGLSPTPYEQGELVASDTANEALALAKENAARLQVIENGLRALCTDEAFVDTLNEHGTRAINRLFEDLFEK